MSKEKITASKFLSLILRHRPDEIGPVLDESGWAEIEYIVRLTQGGVMALSRDLIADIAATSDKKRFKISPDGRRIRASQGHSVSIDLGLKAVVPPEVLYHGTADRFMASIERDGLKKGTRQHVHLAGDQATATNVGRRHGRPVVLRVAAGEMHRAGYDFFVSENGVWLTGEVPASFLKMCDAAAS